MILLAKLLLLAAVFPLLIALYLERARGSSDSNGKAWRAWTIDNRYFLLLLLAVAVGGYLEVTSSARAEAPRKPMEFLPLSAFERELSAISPAEPNSANWPAEKEQLLRKFEHGEYAWEAGDYGEALKALQAIDQGKDHLGDLHSVESYTVKNNLGCIYFAMQRNKNFKAYDFLRAAQSLAKAEEVPFNAISQNLSNLDEMVNSLD